MSEGDTRLCMRCRKPMIKKHKFNFLCRKCADTNKRQSGGIPIQSLMGVERRGGIKGER
jgi:hypothetical protein